MKRPAILLLLLLATTMMLATSARSLDEQSPADEEEVAAAAPAVSLPLPTAGSGGGATAAADQPLSFFMHDILGGTNPTARIVAGIVDNAAVDGQLPFARPNGAVLPINGGVAVNGAGAGSGAVNNNNIPFLTGLGGSTNVVAGAGNGGSLPFFAGGNLPAGTSLEKLLFGTMTVMDDELTEGPELGSGVVGRAQGFYVASSEEGTSQTLAFTAMFKEGDYANSLSFFGVHRTAESESHVAVVGGTGTYVNAKGFATVANVQPVNPHETDGVESVLQFTVYLAY